jgi:TonB family protein
MTRIRITYLVLFATLAGLVLAAQTTDEPVYEIGHGVTPPRLTHRVEPEHPAHGFRITGAVLVGLVVTSKGEARDVYVVQSLEKEVDQAAVDAVKQWRFDPATKEGKPVAVKVRAEIRFHDM